MEKTEGMFSARMITITAVLLAICIASQFFKNLSIFITGPIINTCIMLTVLLVNLPCALALCIITPVTAYFIASSPVMMAVPGILPLIMLGNAVLAVCTHFLVKPAVSGSGKIISVKSVCMAFVSAAAKGLVMGLTISLWLLPTFIPEQSPLRGKLGVFQMTFGLFQFITALIGCVYVFILLIPLRKTMEAKN